MKRYKVEYSFKSHALITANTEAEVEEKIKIEVSDDIVDKFADAYTFYIDSISEVPE